MTEGVHPPAAIAAVPVRVAITTTDVLKLAGVVLLLLDHAGMFFDADQDWWRVFGRLAAPIFFFLMGFARSRGVPWTWIAFGLLLTAVDFWTAGSDASSVSLNVLINFVFIRLVRGAVEEQVMPYPARLWLLVAVTILLIPALDPILEYGAEGWLWALLGLSHRIARERSDPSSGRMRDAVAVAAVGAYLVAEILDYELGPSHAAALGVMVVGLALILVRFRRADLAWRPPPALGAVVHACGRRSLEIYAVSLLAMQVSSYGLGLGDGSEGVGEKGEDGDAERS